MAGTQQSQMRSKLSMRLLVISRSLDYMITQDMIIKADLDLPLREAQNIVENVRDKLPPTAAT
jgi:hypothetical protein